MDQGCLGSCLQAQRQEHGSLFINLGGFCGLLGHLFQYFVILTGPPDSCLPPCTNYLYRLPWFALSTAAGQTLQAAPAIPKTADAVTHPASRAIPVLLWVSDLCCKTYLVPQTAERLQETLASFILFSFQLPKC